MLANTMASIAIDFINQFGDSIVIQKVEIQGYNPATHKNDTTITDMPAKGVIDSVSQGDVIEGIVRISDKKITMYAEIKDIDESWTINGCNIISINKIGFQDILVVYEVIVRCS